MRNIYEFHEMLADIMKAIPNDELGPMLVERWSVDFTKVDWLAEIEVSIPKKRAVSRVKFSINFSHANAVM